MGDDLDQPGSRYERPGFLRAVEAVEQGEAAGIIVAKLDRFARSVAGRTHVLSCLVSDTSAVINVRRHVALGAPEA